MATDPVESSITSLKKLYLVVYNSSLAVAWSLVLLKAAIHVTEQKTDLGLYEEVEFWLKIAQTAALLEILHAAFGLVRSSVLVTTPQVASRLFVLWVIVDGLVMKGSSTPIYTIGFPMLLFAWTLTEIIRYTFYTNSLLDIVVYSLKWCRYTFFIILYPMGVTGEILCILVSLPVAQEAGRYSIHLPNIFNISFDFAYGCYILIFLVYPPGFYFLYTYMLKQRRKVLSDKHKNL